MSDDRERFDKVIAVAINPGAYENEAIVALRKARELVRKDPTLAHPASKISAVAPPDDTSVVIKVTKVPLSWLSVLLSSLSEQAYDYGLKIKMTCDFTEVLASVTVTFDGPKERCADLEAYLTRLIVLINKPRKS